jgi:hypothetical protein
MELGKEQIRFGIQVALGCLFEKMANLIHLMDMSTGKCKRKRWSGDPQAISECGLSGPPYTSHQKCVQSSLRSFRIE